MEEPPKIERIITTRGISLLDTATILKAYMSDIDRYHHHTTDAIPPIDKEDETSSKEGEAAMEVDGQGKIDALIRKTRREREEEALIAQMDKLVNNGKSGMISDDIYERLKMITDSIRAEAEGTPLVGGNAATESADKHSEEEEQIIDAGANDLPTDSEGAHRPEKLLEQRQRTTPAQQHGAAEGQKSKRDRKKEKKAKKAAKKSARKAKRKAREMEDEVGDGGGSSKRAKMEN